MTDPDARAAAPESTTDRVPLAIGAVLVSVFALSAGDAIIKLTSARFPIWQIYVLRSLLVLPVLVVLLRWREPDTPLAPTRARWVLLRSALLVSMWVAYYTALPRIDLSLAAAAYYTSPLLIVLLSARLAGDRVGPVVWAAVALGFAGVLVMLRPGSVPFDAHVLLPLAAALLYALAMIVTRARCVDESPLVLALALNLAFVAVGAVATTAGVVLAVPPALEAANPFLFGPWTALGGPEAAAIAALGAAMLIGSVGAAIAYQVGPAPVVATFDYAYLVFAALWGALLFAEVPDPMTLLGMAMIAAGGMLAVRGHRPRASPARTG